LILNKKSIRNGGWELQEGFLAGSSEELGAPGGIPGREFQEGFLNQKESLLELPASISY